MFRKLIALLAAPALVAAQTQQMTQHSPRKNRRSVRSPGRALRLAKENNIAASRRRIPSAARTPQIRVDQAQLYPNLTAVGRPGHQRGDRIGQSGTLVPYASVWTYNTGLELKPNAVRRPARRSPMFARAGRTSRRTRRSQVTHEFSVALKVKHAIQRDARARTKPKPPRGRSSRSRTSSSQSRSPK